MSLTWLTLTREPISGRPFPDEVISQQQNWSGDPLESPYKTIAKRTLPAVVRHPQHDSITFPDRESSVLPCLCA